MAANVQIVSVIVGTLVLLLHTVICYIVTRILGRILIQHWIRDQWRRKKFESAWGHRSGSKLRNFLVVPLHFFGSKNRPTISRFREHFRDGQYSLVSFAVLLLTVPPCAQRL